MPRRALLLPLAAVLVLLAACGGATSFSTHASGLVIVSGDEPPPDWDERQRGAYGALELLAEEHQAELGPPWWDSGRATIVLPVARALPAGEMAEVTRPADDAGVPVELRPGSVSQARLQDVQNTSIDVGQEFPEDEVWQSVIDRPEQRVVLTVERLSDALAERLVTTYGPLISVRLEEDPKNGF